METILIVDDEKNYLLVLEDLLAEEGYQVITADLAQNALDIMGNHDLDAIITDMKMPGMDGMTLMERVHANNPDLPVIMMTGLRFRGEGRRGHAKGGFRLHSQAVQERGTQSHHTQSDRPLPPGLPEPSLDQGTAGSLPIQQHHR